MATKKVSYLTLVHNIENLYHRRTFSDATKYGNGAVTAINDSNIGHVYEQSSFGLL
jgi:hypothetical protein